MALAWPPPLQRCRPWNLSAHRNASTRSGWREHSSWLQKFRVSSLSSLTLADSVSLSSLSTEERASKLAEFRERIALLGKELEGLAESKLLKEEAFLVRFLLSQSHPPHPLPSISLRFLRGSNWDVDIGAELIAGSHRMIQDYYPYMSAGPPSALEHVWKRDLIFSPEMRDGEGRRVVVLRLGQWPPQEVACNQCFPNFPPRFLSLTSSPESSPCSSWSCRRREPKLQEL